MNEGEGKKVIVIAGASSGTGKAMALHFGKLGYRVAFCARRFKLLREIESKIKEGGGNALAVRADMSVWEDVKKFVDTVIDTFGRIDVLVNNVGAGIRFSNFENYSIEEIDYGIAVNLHSVIYACRAVVPVMKDQGSGHIINVSSILGKRSRGGFAVYSAAKHGVEGFSRALLNEVRSYGIKVSILAPAAIETPWAEKAGVKLDSDVEFLKPDDLAKVVELLVETPPHVDIWNIDIISREQVIDPL